ncbi:MAG: hypothetical protein R3212_12990, partial [Xanthomonadales bacterium]|nr:hypothetical protein [Xanthomonadales bacterium]
MLVSSGTPGSDRALYWVDIDRVMNAAADALKAAFPELSADEVILGNDVYVQCGSTRSDEHVFVLDETFNPCEAHVTFDLSASGAEHLYVNRGGECVKAMPPGGTIVYVFEDASTKVETHRGKASELQVVECEEDVVSKIATAGTPTPATRRNAGQAFSVNPEAILKRALTAATAEYPDASPESLDLEGM